MQQNCPFWSLLRLKDGSWVDWATVSKTCTFGDHLTLVQYYRTYRWPSSPLNRLRLPLVILPAALDNS